MIKAILNHRGVDPAGMINRVHYEIKDERGNYLDPES